MSKSPIINEVLLSDDGIYVKVAQNVSPAKFDYVFLPTDNDGTPGQLNRFGFKELGLEFPDFTKSDLNHLSSQGHLIYEKNSKTKVIMIVTVGKGSSEYLFEENFRTAIEKNKPSLSGSRIWVPLMGTGIGRISKLKSLKIILNIILENQFERPQSEFVISLPSALSSKELSSIEDFISKFEHFTLGKSNTEEIFSLPRVTDESQIHSDRSIEKREDDVLNRGVIADVLAENIAEVWEEHRKNNWSFIVHISGRWGSGKSSVLNMLKHNLTTNMDFAVAIKYRHSSKKHPWVVADFNAWLEQSGDKVWWAILNSVKRALWPNWYQGFSDTRWRFWRRWKHWIISGIIIMSLILVLGMFPKLIPFFDTENKGRTGNPFGIIVAFMTTMGTLFAVFNRFSPSAQKTSEAFVELDDQTLAPLTRRYHKMVIKSKKPVAVFIDDLDRCDAEYVVNILEVLQTVYSKTPVLYIIAADRDWIISAYEQKYKDFKAALSKPGQPLGYIFLKKIFQMSLTLPDLSAEDKDLYLNNFLTSSSLRNFHESQADDKTDKVVKIEDNELTRKEKVAKIARQTKQEIEENLPHRLTQYASFIEPNPRSVKRLINAYQFKYLYNKLGGFKIDLDDLVIWSILELRFPYVAYQLLQNPELIDIDVRNKSGLTDDKISLFAEPEIINILSKLSKDVVVRMRNIS